MTMLRAFRIFETRMGIPLRVFYSNTSSPSAAASIASGAAAPAISGDLQFAISERPLTSAERANFTANAAVQGDSVHFPLFVNLYGLFYNVPGNRAKPLNITACLAARILVGEISDWTHPDFLDPNPTFVKATADSFRITVFMDSPTSGATMAVLSWLAAACPSVPVTYSTIRTDAVLVGGNMIAKLQATPFALGWAMAAVGRAASIPEFAVETGKAGQFLVTRSNNATAMYDKLAAVVPTTLTGDYSGVSVSALPAPGVAPILALTYLITRSSWNQSAAEAQRGEAVRALCRFFHTSGIAGSAADGFISEYGLLPLGDATLAAIAPAVSSAFVTLPSAVPYSFTDGNGDDVVSSTRSGFDVETYRDMLAQLSALRRTVGIGAARVMRGAGSSAASLFIWRVFSEMRARSTSPLHLVYRATGSGAGQSEVVAKASGYQAIVDFGISDTPMPDSSYADLTANAKIAMVHIPVLLAPMNFFVNIPEGVLPSRQLKMSPCTIAKIMQASGDWRADITFWNHSDIAADNGGFNLPGNPITVFYRQLSSGTTAVITAYLTAACPGWRLGSGSQLSSWPSSFRPTANSVNMSTSVAATPWAIGYMDAANGLDLNLLEVAVMNRDGNFVTTQTGDVPGAASALFKSDAWPKNPTQSFSAVSVLNQPGAATFPIVAMPFMFVRTDLTARGDAGALLQAFVTFMLDSYAQNVIAPAAGFSPLPAEVRQYTTERALPLLQIDTRAKMWTFESGSVLQSGAGSNDYVISSFAGSFENTNAASFADFFKAYSVLQNKANAVAANATNATSATNRSNLADVPANLRDKLDQLDKQIKILEAIAIAGICFGIVGLTLAIFSSCRIFVHSTLWGGLAGSGLVHPSSANPGSSSTVRRQKSTGNLSECGTGSLHGGAGGEI
ncbi:hypothetical protein PLESTF_001297400 [Pleodorina starrii]|nr:hypothetical protein PLESTF_001297400 [Pleodorina starrii]